MVRKRCSEKFSFSIPEELMKVSTGCDPRFYTFAFRKILFTTSLGKMLPMMPTLKEFSKVSTTSINRDLNLTNSLFNIDICLKHLSALASSHIIQMKPDEDQISSTSQCREFQEMSRGYAAKNMC